MLTGAAINTLYDIIQRAQKGATTPRTLISKSAPSPSSSALFRAYEHVLVEQGLQPSDDAILHRFLFRMQEKRRDGEDLMQRFRRVLGDMEIEFEVDEDGQTDVTKTRNGAVAALGRHSRRSSFDSFFDGAADKVAGTDYADLPMRPRAGSNAGTMNGNGNGRGMRRAASDTEGYSYQPGQLPLRQRVNGNAHRHKRSASVSSRGSLHIRRDGVTSTSRVGDYDADDSEPSDRTTSLDLSNIQVPGINAPIPTASHQQSHHQPYVPQPFRPSDTRLLDDAETFEEQRLHRVVRQCIHTWRDQTLERQSIRNDMERLAIARDRRVLLKLSFEQLRDTFRVRQAERETQRFFSRLEERADRARNLFLMTKAFTHWAKSAEDEVQRTSVARRHILRTRFFNGWRDITAVNELKIQHFVLAKFLRQWRSRSAAVRDNTRSAVALYEENLVHRIYREWFFKFCAIAAPAWRNDRMRKMTLHKMSEIAKVLRERQDWAVDRWERGVLRKTFQEWRQRTTAVQALEPQADNLSRTALMTSTLRMLQKQAQLAPLLRQFQERANDRIVRTTFQTWQHTARLSCQARNVDKMRILRNAYTAWNDQLRIKALEDRINDRIIVETLYKWTLASRVSLFQRVHDRQLKERTFLTWVTKANQRSNTLEAAETRFAQFKRAQMLRMCLRKMEALTTEKRAEEFAVVAEYQQKLKQRVFDQLKDRLKHFQKLNNWSAAARFYVLSKSTIKTWGEATQHARRNRRRDIYIQFRRTVKVNLVRKLFANWREKANHVAHLNQQANDSLENRTMQASGAILHQWHDRTITLRQQDTQATNVFSFKLETRYFRVWTDRVEALQRLDAQAVALRQESTELAATSALKKLGWRLWNIQRQEENARALYDRNFEKHVRAMIRFWAERVGERETARVESPTPSSRRGRRDDDDDFDAGGKKGHDLSTWTAFNSNLNSDLDLSLSITPQHRQSHPPQASLPRSILRPSTFPQTQSALRPPPQTIPEDSILDPAFARDLDRDLADLESFWSGTPAGPPPAHQASSFRMSTSTATKPGYLKTPSKRSVVRAKRPELPASPEKPVRVLSPVRGTSAPPARRFGVVGDGGAGVGGVKSFQRRLRESGVVDGSGREKGFSKSLAVAGGIGKGKGKGKARVGFGDVREGERGEG